MLFRSCVKAQNIAFINKALELGANSNAGLPEAIASKNVEIIEILFNKGADGSTPSLMVDAVNTSDINIVKLMLNHGGDANNGTLRAVQIGHVEILNHLLTSGNGSNPELIATASSMGNNEIITILLNKGADANNGLLPAVNQNKIETVKLLLQNGANAKTKDILIEPSKKGQLELVQLLVENGANATEGLMSAVQNNKPKVLEYLIDNKADISNKLLIIGAVNSNYTAIVDVLIRKGADLTVKDDQSNNLLHLSAAKYSLEVSRQLINSGKVDINAINNNNHTPLMVVAINSKGKSEHLCQLMVTNGADVNARDGNFETIYQIAKGRKVKKYLKSVGAPKK